MFRLNVFLDQLNYLLSYIIIFIPKVFPFVSTYVMMELINLQFMAINELKSLDTYPDTCCYPTGVRSPRCNHMRTQVPRSYMFVNSQR